jgi:hypothetical protein
MTYCLPIGIISEARDHKSMLLDMINWMSVQDGLYDTMNALATQNGDGGWSERDYIQLSIASDSDHACAIFDVMRDLTPFLPEGHMWGWSDGKLGIFECRIKIIVEEKPEPKFKFLYADRGFCRTYYRALYKPNRLYCFQDDGRYGNKQINFYLCSGDGEPDVLCVPPADNELDMVCKP